jgi:hypothetical protein
LCDNFRVQNDLIQGDALSPLLFNFALEYAIRKVQENQVELKLNETHQLLVYDHILYILYYILYIRVYILLVYTDDVNLLGDNIYTKKKNTATLIYASKEVGL